MGVEDKLGEAKVNIAGIEGEFTVAKVKGMLEDEADVEESNKGTTPMLCTIYSCSGRTCSARTYVPLVRVRCQVEESLREGRDGGLIEFEVKGEQLRWKTEWSMEWGIEVGGELRRMTWTKG